MKNRMYFSDILSQLSASLGAALKQRKTPDSSQLGQTGNQQSAHQPPEKIPPEKISELQLQQNSLEAMRNLESVADEERRLANNENTLDFAGRTDFHAKLTIAADGRITLHLAGDIQIDGLTSTEEAKAVKERLRYQKQSSSPPIMRDRPFAAAPPPSVETTPTERESARTQSTPAATQPATAARSQTPPAPAPARSPAPAAPAPTVSARASAPPSHVASAAAPPPAPRPGIRLPAFKPSIEPEAVSEPEASSSSEIPWWLSGSALSGSVSDQPSSSALVTPSAAKPREPEIAPVKPRKEDVVAARIREAEEAAIKAREAEFAASRKLEAELLAARQRQAALLAEQMRRSQSAETPQLPEPRLSGLRNVLFSLGLNNPNSARTPETRQEQPPPLHEPQRRREEPVPAQAQALVPYVEREIPIETARVVTADPEFLPPQTESSRKDRHDRRDAYDEVEILPPGAVNTKERVNLNKARRFPAGFELTWPFSWAAPQNA